MPSTISQSGSATLFHPLNQAVDQQKNSESVYNGLQSQNVNANPSSNGENKDFQFHTLAYEQPQYYAPTIYTNELETETNGAIHHRDMNGNTQKAVHPGIIFNPNCRIQHNVYRNMSGSVRSMNRAPLNAEDANELTSNTSSESSEDEDQIEMTPNDGNQKSDLSGPLRSDNENGILNRQFPLIMQPQDHVIMQSRDHVIMQSQDHVIMQSQPEYIYNGLQSQDSDVMPADNRNFLLPGSVYGKPKYNRGPIYANTHMLGAEIKGAEVYQQTIRSNKNIQNPVYHSSTFNPNRRFQHNVQTNVSVKDHRVPMNIELCSSTSSELDKIVEKPKDGQGENLESRRCIDEVIRRPELPLNVVSSYRHKESACSKSFLKSAAYCILLGIGLVVGAGISSLYKYWSEKNERYS